MAVRTVIFMSFLDLRLYKHFFSLVFHILLVLLQLLLTNLQNVLKVDKNGNLNGFNSRVKAALLLSLSAYVQKFINNQPKYVCYS